jgi:hypothetical protein
MVRLRCPVCRAGDNSGVQCRRCKADLSLLVRVEEERDQQLQAARYCAHKGQGDACLLHAGRADLMRRDADSLQWIAVGHLLVGDFGMAYHCYRLMGLRQDGRRDQTQNSPPAQF